MDRPARTLSGSLMHRVLSHAYVWVPIMAPDTFSCPLSLGRIASPAPVAPAGLPRPCSWRDFHQPIAPFQQAQYDQDEPNHVQYNPQYVECHDHRGLLLRVGTNRRRNLRSAIRSPSQSLVTTSRCPLRDAGSRYSASATSRGIAHTYLASHRPGCLAQMHY